MPGYRCSAFAAILNVTCRVYFSGSHPSETLLWTRKAPQSIQAQQPTVVPKFCIDLKRGNEERLSLPWGQFCPPFDSLLANAVCSLDETTGVSADIFLRLKKRKRLKKGVFLCLLL